MPSPAPEDQLRADLRALDKTRLANEETARQLYRALTNRRWARPGDEAEQAVALTWGQAEALVNTLREERGLKPLVLAGSGGEGWLSDAAADALQGWVSQPVLPAPTEAERPLAGDSASLPPVRPRRFARRPVRYPSADLMWSRRTPGGPPPQASA